MGAHPSRLQVKAHIPYIFKLTHKNMFSLLYYIDHQYKGVVFML